MSQHVMTVLAEFAEKHDASLGVVRHEEGHWLVSMEWGQEAPDSPMVGAASYGTGDTFLEAIREVLLEVTRDEVVCRAQLSTACYHARRVVDTYGGSCDEDHWPHMDLDGSFDGKSVVCDACYEIVVQHSDSGMGLHTETASVIKIIRNQRGLPEDPLHGC